MSSLKNAFPLCLHYFSLSFTLRKRYLVLIVPMPLIYRPIRMSLYCSAVIIIIKQTLNTMADNLVCQPNESSESTAAPDVCCHRIEGSSFRILPLMLLFSLTGLSVRNSQLFVSIEILHTFNLLWHVPPPGSPCASLSCMGYPYFMIFLRS